MYERDTNRIPNGCVIKTFRKHAYKHGYDRSDMENIFQEEIGRLRGVPPTSEGLQKYIRMSRAGSHYRLNRAMRVGLFCQLVAKKIIK